MLANLRCAGCPTYDMPFSDYKSPFGDYNPSYDPMADTFEP